MLSSYELYLVRTFLLPFFSKHGIVHPELIFFEHGCKAIHKSHRNSLCKFFNLRRTNRQFYACWRPSIWFSPGMHTFHCAYTFTVPHIYIGFLLQRWANCFRISILYWTCFRHKQKKQTLKKRLHCTGKKDWNLCTCSSKCWITYSIP